MTEIFLFGAGGGGSNALPHLERQGYEVRAFVDNNDEMVGTTLHGIPVRSPADLDCSDGRAIHVASSYFHQIKKQLLALGHGDEKIIAVPQRFMKQGSFSDGAFCRFAHQLLGAVSNFLEQEEISYWVDFGTLLGIIRDNHLIPWDSDVDFSIHAEDFQKLLERLEALKAFAHTQGIDLDVKVLHDGKPNNRIKLFALFDGDVFLDMDLFCRHYENDEAYVIICETKYVTPKSFFSGHETLSFETMPLRTPTNPEDYLESLYGADWRQPRKEWSQADYSKVSLD